MVTHCHRRPLMTGRHVGELMHPFSIPVASTLPPLSLVWLEQNLHPLSPREMWLKPFFAWYGVSSGIIGIVASWPFQVYLATGLIQLERSACDCLDSSHNRRHETSALSCRPVCLSHQQCCCYSFDV